MNLKIDVYNNNTHKIIKTEILPVCDLDTYITDVLNKNSISYGLTRNISDSGVISLYNEDLLIEIYEYKQYNAIKDIVLNNIPNIKSRISDEY
jgi:hypothetical protein